MPKGGAVYLVFPVIVLVLKNFIFGCDPNVQYIHSSYTWCFEADFFMPKGSYCKSGCKKHASFEFAAIKRGEEDFSFNHFFANC